MNRSKTVLLTTATLIALAPFAASAQDQSTTQPQTPQADPSGDEVNAIVVTARKRAENILNVPVSITAFTGDDLETRGVKTTTDLANFTPSLTNDTAAAGGARVDRSSQLFIIRGMAPSNSLNPTTSVFLNGTPVGGSDMIQNLDDIDHVEVLKGPQSAYFGRETFAGAINVVAKPAGDTFSGDFSGEAATRNTYRASGSVTVPVMQGLSFRIGGLYDKRDGSYDNAYNPSERLGNQETKGGHLAITIKPDDNLTIKAFGTIFEDDDGPAATGLILLNGPAAFNQSNCAVGPLNTRLYCGTLPSLDNVTPAQVDKITPGQQNFFNNPGGLINSSDIVRGFGLKRQANHVDISIDWKVLHTGLTLSYLAGWNRDNYSEVSDLANIDGGANGQYPGYGGFPFLVETRNHDYSHELRLASDPARRLRFLLGGSFLNVYHEAINYFLGLPMPGPAPQGSPSISLTRGAFFSVSFDILHNLTLTGEGRYQADTEEALNVAHNIVARGTSKDFLPRVTLQYKPIPGLLAYATYSKGVNPGVFNTQFNAIPTASQQELVSSGAAGSLLVAPEKLDNYEIGFKGRFWDGRATLQLAGYYDRWNNQLQTNVFLFSATDPANPYNIPGYAQYNPANVSNFIYSYQSNNASSTAKGIEGEATIIPIRHVTLNISGSINDTKYDKFLCTSCAGYPFVAGSTTLTGFQAAGKRLPFAPEYSAAVGIEYRQPISWAGATDFYGRVDYLYHSGIYISQSNVSETPSSNVVNLRAGINFQHFAVEGFVNNVFNERAYTTGFENFNFAGGFGPAVLVGLPTLITAGGRVRFRF